ncbi:MAG: hypothetical protein JW982_03620 [Spirochaetes bacterium]|nr:hypothetical protein [Spirochaetota bacterium]
MTVLFGKSTQKYQVKAFHTEPVFNFNYQKKESIDVTLRIEVSSQQKSEEKEIQCTLIPVIESCSV